MYKRYLDMNEDDIAAAFGTSNTSQIVTEIVTSKLVASHK